MSKKKVVILGGGMAGCTAAYWLSCTEALRETYDVTLYQLGWRLGGKGASGREPEHAHRSLEHGPHGWFGFYQRAFQTLRGCYDAMDEPNGPWRDCFDAFVPGNEVAMCDKFEGEWDLWKIQFEEQDMLEPGDPALGDDPVSPAESVRRMTEFVITNSQHFGTDFPATAIPPAETLARSPHWQARRDEKRSDQHGHWLDIFADRMRDVRPDMDRKRPVARKPLLVALDQFRRSIPDVVEPAAKKVRSLREEPDSEANQKEVWRQDENRRIGVLVDFITTVMYGFIRDALWIRGFDHINHYDFQEWLQRHGGTYCTVAENALLRSLYDIAFSYRGGDTTHSESARLAAGVGVRTVMSAMFGFSRHALYRMKAGMGEVVFTAVYEGLQKNGVDVQFFHRVEQVSPDPSGKRVETVVLRRQARVLEGDYQPLIQVPLPDGANLRCWPEEPLGDQLELTDGTTPGDRLPLDSFWSTAAVGPPLTLEHRSASASAAAGTEVFDQVILAMPPAAQKHIAGDLMARDAGYRDMVERLGRESARTANCQLWFDLDAIKLGWDRHEEFEEDTAVLGYEPLFNTMLDHSLVLESETWTEPKPHSLYYLCGPYPDDPNQDDTDPGYPATQTRAAHVAARDWLNLHSSFWPSATVPGKPKRLDPCALQGDAASLEEALENQYVRCNVNPWDLYVQSMPGSTRYRLPANGTRFRNLVLAGDWTRNGIDVGCIESAARSGYYAALAVRGEAIPRLDATGWWAWLKAVPAGILLAVVLFFLDLRDGRRSH